MITGDRTLTKSAPEGIDGERTIAKVRRRLLPFLAICFFANYLDRVNIGFAALEMNKDLGLSATVFGLGSGIFLSLIHI